MHPDWNPPASVPIWMNLFMQRSCIKKEANVKTSMYVITTTLLAVYCTATLAGATEVESDYSHRFAASYRDSVYLDSIATHYCTTYHAPGMTYLIMAHGDVIWLGHYGWSNIEQGLPPNDSTSWDAGSIAKTVTAVAAMKAWEDSFYGLDDDINDYLPFTVTNPFYPDDSITQRMLLTHTSSLENPYWSNLVCFNGDPLIPLDTALYNYLNPAGYWYTTINFGPVPPGSQCLYSNAGSGLAGYFTQAVTDDSLPMYCRQHIFEPLGMNHTSWWYSELDTNNVAMQYNYNGQGQYVRVGGTGIASHSIYPAGILKFSALDLSRFLQAFAQYGRLDTVRILDSTTVALMRTIQDTIVYGSWVVPIGITWWHYYSPSTGSWCWGHAGASAGTSAAMTYYEDFDIGVIILSNGEIDAIQYLMAEMTPALCHWALQHGIAESTIEPARIVKLDVAPNPFTLNTNIRYSILDARSSMQNPAIDIYDAAGRLVKSFNLESSIENQESAISWRGDDDDGRKLPGGVYFIKLSAGNLEETKKVLLVR